MWCNTLILHCIYCTNVKSAFCLCGNSWKESFERPHREWKCRREAFSRIKTNRAVVGGVGKTSGGFAGGIERAVVRVLGEKRRCATAEIAQRRRTACTTVRDFLADYPKNRKGDIIK
jgi:hypothetical protein